MASANPVLEMRSIHQAYSGTPVLAGVCGTDPFRLMPVFLRELKAIGFSGVQNFPTVGLIDGVFPLGTLLVNVAGCLTIGYVGTLLAGPLLVREEYRIAALVGFLGGFTTFSTFGWETLALLDDGEWGAAAINVLASNVLGLVAVWFGHRLAVVQGA